MYAFVRGFLLIVSLLFAQLLCGQSSKLDSLNRMITSAKDTQQVNLLNSIAHTYLKLSKLDSSIIIAEKAREISAGLDYYSGMGNALLIEGRAFDYKNRFDSAIFYYREAIPFLGLESDINSRSSCYQGLGNSYWAKGASDKALSNYMIAAKLRETTKDSFGIACSYMGLGNVYSDLKKFNLSVNYSEKAMRIMERLGDKKYVSWLLNNIGAAYMEAGDTVNAINYYSRSIVLKKELQDIYGLATTYSNIGNIYLLRKMYKHALEYYNLSLKYRLESSGNNDLEYSNSYNEIGNVNLLMKNYDEAEKYLLKSIALGEKMNSYYLLKHPYLAMSNLKNEKGDPASALDYYKKYHSATDSLLNQESSKLIHEMSERFETEKKEQQISMQQLEIDKQNRSKKFLLGLVALAVVLVFVMFRSYHVKRKANILLGQKNEFIAFQKHIVEEKNKDITDSIRYAKRIQQAILPSEEYQKKILPDSFVLYKPKDIVSGDFYWIEKWGKEVVVAAVDCTGHGVPGAFMSFVAYSLLNEAVIEHGITQPAVILNEMRKSLNKMLRQKNDDAALKDGMDVALCAFDLENNKLNFAGAYNALWLIRDNKCIEYKADKQPVGAFGDGEELKPFTNHAIGLQKGDIAYIFTDGYADQFGGTKGKKFKYKQLEQLLISVHLLPLNEQKHMLDQTIEEWRGGLEQVDDMLIIGIKI